MLDRGTKKITLIIVREDKDAVLSELIALGCVEITEPDALLADPELAGLLTREEQDCDTPNAELEVIALGINILEYYAPSSKSERARLKVAHENFFDESIVEESLELAKTLETLDTKVQVLTDAEAVEESQERLLEVAEVKDMIAAQIANEASRRAGLRIAHDHIAAKAAIAAETDKLLGTEYALVLTGWFADRAEQRLVHVLSKHPCVWEFKSPAREEPDVPFSPGGNVFHRLQVALFKLFKKNSYREIAPLMLRCAYTDIIQEQPARGKHRIDAIDANEVGIEEGYTISIDASGGPDPTSIDPEAQYTGEIELPGADTETADAKKPNVTDVWVNDNERY
jgi:hypothetical protein